MSSAQAQANDAEKNIEIWKVKKLIKRLEAARGNGTSMISLIIRTLLIPSRLQSVEPHANGHYYSAQGSSVPCGEDVG